jgi:anti-anti-sigma factor
VLLGAVPFFRVDGLEAIGSFVCDAGGRTCADPSVRQPWAKDKMPHHRAHDLPRNPIDVDLRPAHAPSFAAVVRLCGEHDLATERDLRDVLRSILGDVLVDLSECEFISSSVIGLLLADAYARKGDGHRLELVVPPENRAVRRTIQVSGIDKLMCVRAEFPSITDKTQEPA